MQCSLFIVYHLGYYSSRWQIHLKTNLQNSRFSLKPDKINLYIFISSAWIFFFYPILVTKCMRLKRKGELINFQPPCMVKVPFFPSVVRSTLPGCDVNAVYAACLSLHRLLSEHSFIRALSINLRKLQEHILLTQMLMRHVGEEKEAASEKQLLCWS